MKTSVCPLLANGAEGTALKSAPPVAARSAPQPCSPALLSCRRRGRWEEALNASLSHPRPLSHWTGKFAHSLHVKPQQHLEIGVYEQ